MFLFFTLIFSLSRHYFDPTSKALEAAWDLVGDSLLAFNVARIWLSNTWLFSGINSALIITQPRIYEFDLHIVMVVSWYLSLLPYTQDTTTFIHHLLSAIMGYYGYYNNVTYLGFLLLSLMIWSNLPLAVSKLLYETRSKHAVIVFDIFAVVFFITRVVVFPLHYMPIVLYVARDALLDAGVYHSLVCGLFVLVLMQFLWFPKILRLCLKSI